MTNLGLAQECSVQKVKEKSIQSFHYTGENI